jgi:hypothetical protein
MSYAKNIGSTVIAEGAMQELDTRTEAARMIRRVSAVKFRHARMHLQDHLRKHHLPFANGENRWMAIYEYGCKWDTERETCWSARLTSNFWGPDGRGSTVAMQTRAKLRRRR